MNYQTECDKVTDWIEGYFLYYGIKKAVIGLSGGIDSSIIACLTVKAVEAENVIGVKLPCESRADMGDDADILANNLGIELRTIDLNNTFQALSAEIPVMAVGDIDNTDANIITQANIKARLRMTALYGIANQVGGIVVGTTNLSEMIIGYFTKWGDGGVDIEPIAEYYKTEVYEMAKTMKDKIPENIISKEPSADLWEGQTDEKEIGMTYAELDDILKHLVKITPGYLRKRDPEKVQRVTKLVRGANHKKRPAPAYHRDDDYKNICL